MEAEVRSGSIGFVRAYPSTLSRLTTDTESPIGAVAGEQATGDRLGVVDDAGSFDWGGEVRATYTTVSILHALGIRSGPDGSAVLDPVSWTGPAEGWTRL